MEETRNTSLLASAMGDQCKKKWKGMKIEAKKEFQNTVKARNQTGGGPPPRELKPCILRTIDLMKDHASFKGVDGGLDMFTDDDAADPYVEVSRVSDIEDQDWRIKKIFHFLPLHVLELPSELSTPRQLGSTRHLAIINRNMKPASTLTLILTLLHLTMHQGSGSIL